MGFGPFSSESSSTQRHTDRSAQVADQGILYQVGDRSGNVTNRVARGGTLTINQGIDEEQFQDFASSLLAQSSINPNSADDRSFKEALLVSLNQRAAANTERAVDEVEQAAPSKVKSYVGWAVGLVVLFALVLVFGRKGK